MLVNIIVGLIFGGILIFVSKKAWDDIRKNKCSCGSSCPGKKKSGKRQ